MRAAGYAMVVAGSQQLAAAAINRAFSAAATTGFLHQHYSSA